MYIYLLIIKKNKPIKEGCEEKRLVPFTPILTVKNFLINGLGGESNAHAVPSL